MAIVSRREAGSRREARVVGIAGRERVGRNGWNKLGL